jgi:predicted kinase
MSDYKEQRFDYSEGRKDAPELVIMVGVSGSGKSVVAKSLVNGGRGKIARLNRDSMRLMLHVDVPFKKTLENRVKMLQVTMAAMLLQAGTDVIIDDTNCIRQTRQKWEDLAKENRVRFRIVRMTTDLDTCIERDKKRGEICPTCGKAPGGMVGESVIRRQHGDLNEMKRGGDTKEKIIRPLTRPYFERTELLKNGGFTARLPHAQWVLVDIDGTVATNEDGRGRTVRSQHDESRVIHDKVRETIVKWVRELYPHHNICFISGRHDWCGDDTCDWLEMHGIPFDHILMRYSGDNRSDVIVKQEILDELAAVIGKENILMVLDDRPRVVEMWRSNGVKVIPVRGTWDHSSTCTVAATLSKGFKECPGCGAIEYF